MQALFIEGKPIILPHKGMDGRALKNKVLFHPLRQDHTSGPPRVLLEYKDYFVNAINAYYMESVIEAVLDEDSHGDNYETNIFLSKITKRTGRTPDTIRKLVRKTPIYLKMDLTVTTKKGVKVSRPMDVYTTLRSPILDEINIALEDGAKTKVMGIKMSKNAMMVLRDIISVTLGIPKTGTWKSPMAEQYISPAMEVIHHTVCHLITKYNHAAKVMGVSDRIDDSWCDDQWDIYGSRKTLQKLVNAYAVGPSAEKSVPPKKKKRPKKKKKKKRVWHKPRRRPSREHEMEDYYDDVESDRDLSEDEVMDRLFGLSGEQGGYRGRRPGQYRSRYPARRQERYRYDEWDDYARGHRRGGGYRRDDYVPPLHRRGHPNDAYSWNR
jgi:hypothetical protein